MTQIKIEANELACRNKEWGWHDDPRCDLGAWPKGASWQKEWLAALASAAEKNTQRGSD
jgi:hypothetical protein